MRGGLSYSIFLSSLLTLFVAGRLLAQAGAMDEPPNSGTQAESLSLDAENGQQARLRDLRNQLADREEEQRRQSQRVNQLAERLTELQAVPADDAAEEARRTERVAAIEEELSTAQRLLERIGSERLLLVELIRMVEGEVDAEPPGDDVPAPVESAPAQPDLDDATDEVVEPRRPGPLFSAEVAEAQARIRAKRAAIEEMEAELTALTSRKVAIERQIEIEQNLLRSAQQREDEQSATITQLDAQLTEKLDAGMPREELRLLQTQISDARRDLQAARSDVRQRTSELASLRGELTSLQSEQVALFGEVQRRRSQMRAAQWGEWMTMAGEFIRYKGPPIVAVLLLMLLLWWMVAWGAKRLVQLLLARGRGTQKERKDRAETLSGFSENALRVAILVGGSLMLLQIAGIPVAPLMGGAAVIGLAVAFGAQNLIRDYFFGFVILFENQYRINDVIRINGMTGLVERITLRLTQLRDVEGRVYFIPNGQITSVVNFTHSWARVVVDMGVAYKENVNQVMQVLTELAGELQQDPQFQDFVMGQPEMFGVDQFAESAVVVRVGLKVRPDMQWVVKREFLRRIKNRFDELGIEIPFPQRTLHIASSPEPGGDDRPGSLSPLR